MKFKAHILTAAGAMLLTTAAQAQFQYSSRDLMLVVRSDISGRPDLEANLGNVAGYISQGINNPGVPVTVGAFNATQYNLVRSGANVLNWTVMGADAQADGDTTYPDRTLWLTKPRNEVLVRPDPFTRMAGTRQGVIAGKILGLGNSLKIWSSGTGLDAVTNSAQVVLIPNNETSAYTDFAGTAGNLDGEFDQAPIDNPLNASTGTYVRSDFYQLNPGSGNGTYLGYFDFNVDGTVTFTAAPIAPPSFATQPVSQLKAAGGSVTFSASVTGTAPFAYQWLYEGSPLSGQTGSSLTLSGLSTNQAGAYALTVTNAEGSLTSSNAVLAFDSQFPVVKVVTPKANFAYSAQPSLTVNGTALELNGLNGVWFRHNNGDLTAADLAFVGTGKATNWSGSISPTPGTNRFAAFAVDTAGNTSTVVNVTFYYNVASTFRLTVLGEGSVQSIPNGALGTPVDAASLFVGRGYKLRALETNAPNWVFTNWTYSVDGGETNVLQTNKLDLAFVMQTNLHVFANFIPNPLVDFGGAYNGLFHDTNGVAFASAGSISFKVTPKFALSGKVYVDGNAVSVSGKLNLDGTFDKVVSRANTANKSDLVVHLALDFANGSRTATGTITDVDTTNGWVAEVLADQNVWSNLGDGFYADAFTNRYTLALPGFTNTQDGPVGYGNALVDATDRLGKVKLAGYLADGAKWAGTAVLSQNGQWPLYTTAYKQPRTITVNSADKVISETKGLVFGWLNVVTNTPANTNNLAPLGTLSWIKTGGTNSVGYPQGFTNTSDVISSRWLPVTSGLVLASTNFTATLTEGNLASPLLATLQLKVNNTFLTLNATNGFKPSLTAKTGLTKASFLHPVTTEAGVKVYGVMLQDYNQGLGSFLSQGNSATNGGTFEIVPTP